MSDKCACGSGDEKVCECESDKSCECETDSCGCGSQHGSHCISYGKGKYEIIACFYAIGKDLVVLIGGGEKPHAGCVVMCEPDKAKGKVTTSVHTFSTHRDEVVAKPIAEELCRKTGTKVVCVCGIHVEKATKKDIELLVKNTQELGRRILKCF